MMWLQHCSFIIRVHAHAEKENLKNAYVIIVWLLNSSVHEPDNKRIFMDCCRELCSDFHSLFIPLTLGLTTLSAKLCDQITMTVQLQYILNHYTAKFSLTCNSTSLTTTATMPSKLELKLADHDR